MPKKSRTEQEVRYAADLCSAFRELPKVRRALTNNPTKYHDAVNLELAAAEMSGGEGQGSKNYFYVSPELGRKILDAAETLIVAELKRMKIVPGK